MTDIGMLGDDTSIAQALSLARKSMDLLCVPGTTVPRSTDEVQLYLLEEASFHFHQLSALLDLQIQQRAATARPQEEADATTGDDTVTDGSTSTVAGVNSGSEEAGP